MRTLRAVLFLAFTLVGFARAGDVTCVRTAEAKETTRTCYRCKVTTVCLTCKPACDDCGPCGKPREVRKLVKRFVKGQAVEPRCEPAAACLGEPVVSPAASGSSTPPAPAPPK